MWSSVSFRFKRCIPFFEIIWKFQEIPQYTPIFWQHIIPISEDAYGIKHIPLHMAILHQCYPQLFTEQKILWSHHGWPSIVYTIKSAHMAKLEDLLKALVKNGLKIPPKKCQLSRMNLHYMGNEILILNKRVCVKPLRSRLEAIQKLQPPHYNKRR